MKVVRSTDYTFEGLFRDLLEFKDFKHRDCILLVPKAKYIDVRNNKVYHLNSNEPNSLEWERAKSVNSGVK